MIDYSHCNIELVSAHFIGNKANEQELQLSEHPLDVSDGPLRGLLQKFFLDAFEGNEFFHFDFSNGDLSLNLVCRFAKQVFETREGFHQQSIDLARHLHEQTDHPKIKSGDLFVAFFSGLVLDDEVLDAVGLFKSENKQSFLKLLTQQADFQLLYEDGTAIDKLDKGCLIFNSNAENGYKICIVDKSNKSIEAQYWRDFFLNVQPLADDYFHTTHYIRMAKDFVVKKMDEDFAVSKAEKIDYLNKSLSYFKENDTLVEEEFAKTVFDDAEKEGAFRQHRSAWQEAHNLPVEDAFQISPASVKKQERGMRSVLKLDKNFHIYIHGDQELIERGYDEAKGKKFYKVYFEEES
ncbi:MAG: nucleoid-associated protein [Bacteroidetes bacterium]|nr:nucleoid-associated protein [Bacteroidota bacterium]